MAKGCVCEKEIFKKSYDVLLSKTALVNPELSAHELRVQVAQKFRPRYKQDKNAATLESSGLEVYDGLDFEVTLDGNIYYPAYGVTSEELNENTRLYNPDQYSPVDHQTSRFVAKTLAGGAAFVATTYARDGNDNRDIHVYYIDRATGKGKTKTINTAKEGKHHTFEEMNGLMQRLFPEYVHTKPVEKVLLVTDKPLPQETAYVRPDISEKVATDTVRTFSYAARRIHADVKQAAIQIFVRFEHKKKLQKISDESVSQQLRKKEAVKIKKTKETTIFPEAGRAKKKLTKEHQKIKNFLIPLLFIAEAGINPGAGLWIVKMLKKEKLFKNKKHFKYEMAQRLNKRERKKQRIEAKRKIKAKENNRIKLKEYKKEKRAKKGERRIHSKTQERKNLVRTIRKLARILRNISSPRVHTEKNFRERIEEKEKIRYRKEIRRMQKEHVVRFAFAWALWLLVRPKTSKKDFHLSIDESKKQKENIVRVKESTYWILLAVIWYLVMIREQRMFVTQKKKQKKKTKALPKPILPFSPQRGIIFAYAT